MPYSSAPQEQKTRLRLGRQPYTKISQVLPQSSTTKFMKLPTNLEPSIIVNTYPINESLTIEEKKLCFHCTLLWVQFQSVDSVGFSIRGIFREQKPS